MHKKCGFREIGYRERIAKDRFGNWQNTTLMELRLENKIVILMRQKKKEMLIKKQKNL